MNVGTVIMDFMLMTLFKLAAAHILALEENDQRMLLQMKTKW